MQIEQNLADKLDYMTPATSDPNKPENGFKKMLATYEPQMPRRGDIIKGEVLKLEDNLAILDVGAKRDAVVPPQEMEEIAEAFREQLGEGDTVPVYVIKTPVGDEELMVSLEKGQREKDWQRAASYLESQEIIEAQIVGKNKGGLLVEFGRLQGFVPNSHVPSLATKRDQQERMALKTNMIGSSLSLKVLDIDRQRKRLLLSARAAREELLAGRLQALEEDQVVLGRIVNLVDYGAFVEFDGITGLLHVSEMAWRRVDDPAELFEAGDEIEVVVQEVDLERKRVRLSRKALLPNQWQQFAGEYEPGDLIEGEVTAVVDFGAFVSLPFEIEGLIHISEMNMPAFGTPQDVLQPGERLIVRIAGIEAERKRVSLSMRQVSAAEEIAWLSTQQQNKDDDQTD